MHCVHFEPRANDCFWRFSSYSNGRTNNGKFERAGSRGLSDVSVNGRNAAHVRINRRFSPSILERSKGILAVLHLLSTNSDFHLAPFRDLSASDFHSRDAREGRIATLRSHSSFKLLLAATAGTPQMISPRPNQSLIRKTRATKAVLLRSSHVICLPLLLRSNLRRFRSLPRRRDERVTAPGAD